MTRYIVCLLLCCLAAWATASPAAEKEKPDRADLGRTVKLRILVDKVMQPQAGWVTEEWMVKATAEAGFNVYSPRLGHDRLDEVRQVARWAAKYGIYHMPWMRGTLASPKGREAQGKRVVWASGNEQPLYSPNSDEFWQWTTRYIVEYARIGAKNPHLMGVFLDYENYAPGREGDLYYLSYDDIILGLFAKAGKIDLPKLELAKRKAWLDEQGLHDRFTKFQVDHWRGRCRALREAVDRIDPTFQFCIYPAPGTPFMVEAVYPEWATARAPLILADASVYGRPSRLLPEQEALEANRSKLIERMKIPKEAGVPYIYTGGIDPVVRGADPEFSGKNAVMISEATDGYWIFYEGPTYTKQDHADYWKWFTWANRAIADGRFQAQHEQRKTPENWGLEIFGQPGKQPAVVPAATFRGTVQFPRVKLRGDNGLVLGCKAGRPVEVVLRNVPVARYRSLLAWELRGPGLAKVASGTIVHDQSQAVRFTPKTDGVYLLGASSGSCAWSVVSANVPVGLLASEGLHLIHGARRFHFRVPEGIKQFTVTIEGAGAETIRANVRAADGDQIATGQTSRQRNKLAIPVTVGAQAAGTWTVELTRADDGVLEDCVVRLGGRLAPILALTPECVFDLNRK